MLQRAADGDTRKWPWSLGTGFSPESVLSQVPPPSVGGPPDLPSGEREPAVLSQAFLSWLGPSDPLFLPLRALLAVYLFPDSLGLNKDSLCIVSAVDGYNLPHHLPDMVLVS